MSRFCALALLGVAMGWVGPAAAAEHAHRLKVVTSFLPVYCFTANVAGELADVQNLLPANVEPHDYQFSRKDLQKLTRADVIIVNGLGLERWLEKAFQISNRTHPAKVVEIAADLDPGLILHNSGAAAPNPHIWLDPRVAAQAVRTILRALQQADGLNASGYAANAARYLARLEKLERDLQIELDPIRGASIVTYHDAFAYFARRYGLHIVGVVEPAPDVQPSLKTLAALYRSIRTSQVKALFTDYPALPRLARQIGSDLHLPVAPLDTLETGSLEPAAYEHGMRNNGKVLLNYLNPNAHRTSP